MDWSNNVEYSADELQILANLAQCTISNGELRMPGNLTDNLNFIRNAIFEYKVPFYKVVGIKAKSNNVKDIKSIVSLLPGFERSYIQFMETVEDIVCAEAGTELKDFVEHIQFVAKNGKVGFACANYLTVDDTGWVNTTNSLFKPTEGISGQIECLVQDRRVTKISSNSCELILVLMKGTGKLEYVDIQRYLPIDVVPNRAVFNLGKYLTVMEQKAGDTAINLVYGSNKINERVLEKIFRDWANSCL